MKNSADLGGCYLLRPKAEVDNANNNKLLFYYSFKILPFRSLFSCSPKITTLSSGFLSQQFNNLQQAALLTSF